MHLRLTFKLRQKFDVRLWLTSSQLVVPVWHYIADAVLVPSDIMVRVLAKRNPIKNTPSVC